LAWFPRTSANGLHMVYGQQNTNSCGIACVMMVNFKMKKANLAIAAGGLGAGIAGLPVIGYNLASAVKVERQVYEAYARVSGKKYDGSQDTSALLLPKVLNELGIGTWVAEWIPQAQLADRIKFSVYGRNGAPVIALVYWRNSQTGHFVVCDTVVRSKGAIVADICDPWDTAVRTIPLTSGSPVVYQADTASGLVDFGQTHYTASSSTGDMNGWFIHRAGH
jgi:hypothetical protein